MIREIMNDKSAKPTISNQDICSRTKNEISKVIFLGVLYCLHELRAGLNCHEEVGYTTYFVGGK